MISGVIDYALYAGGLVLSLISFGVWGTLTSTVVSSAASTAMASVIIFLWVVAIPLAVETLSRGLSAGRLVTGTRVVRDDGGPVRLRQCLVRTLVALVEVWMTSGGLAMCSVIVTRRGKRLGDLLAGTYLIHERTDAKDAPPLIMPPELAGWAAEADLRALPGNLALVCRTFLQRASTTQPAARARLGAQLAAQVEPFVSPPPPWGTHPERFLAAVLVERRDRELFLGLRDRRSDDDARRSLERLPHEIGATA